MKRTSLSAVFLAAAISLASVAAFAAEAPQRYRLNPTLAQTEEIRVTHGGATWIEGVNPRGERVTVQFQKRFATVQRDGERVPVSFLRAGDRVAVTGHIDGHRIQAAAAVLLGAQHTDTPLAAAGAAPCCTEACSDACKRCCSAGTCSEMKDCCTRACSEACRECCSSQQSTARATAADCCTAASAGAAAPASAAAAGRSCCRPSDRRATAAAVGCCR
jgi:hypothetical protein